MFAFFLQVQTFFLGNTSFFCKQASTKAEEQAAMRARQAGAQQPVSPQHGPSSPQTPPGLERPANTGASSSSGAVGSQEPLAAVGQLISQMGIATQQAFGHAMAGMAASLIESKQQ